jgi:hypothetical protein
MEELKLIESTLERLTLITYSVDDTDLLLAPRFFFVSLILMLFPH